MKKGTIGISGIPSLMVAYLSWYSERYAENYASLSQYRDKDAMTQVCPFRIHEVSLFIKASLSLYCDQDANINKVSFENLMI